MCLVSVAAISIKKQAYYIHLQNIHNTYITELQLLSLNTSFRTSFMIFTQAINFY